MSKFEQYLQMKENGYTPEQIYAKARSQESESFSYIGLFRRVYNISSTEALDMIQRGENFYFSEYIFPDYLALKNAGKSAEEVYLATEDDRRFNHIGRFKVLKAVFDLSLTETKEVTIRATADEHEFLRSLREKIRVKKLAKFADLVGCTQAEIQEVMQAQNVEWLPRFYMSFLRTVGKQTGNLWQGTHFTYPHLLTLKERAIQILNVDDNSIILPEEAFIFQMQDGAKFHYFETKNRHPNPPVYVYAEAEYTHRQVDEQLTDFLLNVY